jgi:hypothetical protein
LGAASAARLGGMRIGWGDESCSNQLFDPGTYILSVVLADESDADTIRYAMGGLLLSAQKKVHWRDESLKRREQISGVIAGLPIGGLVVVRSNKPDERPERRRRKCMELLLWELDRCDQLIMESRGPADDQRDRELLDQLRRRNAIAKGANGLHVDHVAGPNDPALWAADALCGAVTSDRIGQPEWLKVINSSVEVRILEID